MPTIKTAARNGGYSRARADQRQSRNVTGFLTAAAPDRRLGALGRGVNHYRGRTQIVRFCVRGDRDP
jgi:hypothetical protein